MSTPEEQSSQDGATARTPEPRDTSGNRAVAVRLPSHRPSREISNLYYSIASLKLQDDPMALQFVASRPGEGASTVASQFATFSARLQTGSALLVDCTAAIQADGARSRGPLWDAWAGPSLVEAYLEDGRIDRAIATSGPTDSPHFAVLSRRMNFLMHDKGNTLADVLELARKRYALVVLDTPSLEESASTLIFSRACDGVIMVVEAEATPVGSAETTIESIERGGGKILGIVFNKRRIHMPRWLFRRL